jgi:hypothetical protein
MLKQMLELSRQGHVVTLAMMITGIVMSRKAQLSVMSSEVPVSAKEKSIEMRLRRWVNTARSMRRRSTCPLLVKFWKR